MELLQWIGRCLFGEPKSKAYQQGDEAYHSGSNELANPYEPGTKEYSDWHSGFFRAVFGLIALLILSTTSGCAGCRNEWKHMQSHCVGLERRITVYGADGAVIREWETQAKVEDKGGTCYFLDKDGKAVIISGVFVIEEK